jgi:phosphatidate phosphatase PAH1
MLFALDSNLSARFTTPNFKTFVEQNHHKTLENLTEAEYDTYKEEYSAFRDSQKRQKLDEEFNKFLALEPVLAPVLTQLEENSKDFNTYA